MNSNIYKVILMAVLCFIPAAVVAQQSVASVSAKPANIPTPMTADGHPDLTGLWNGGAGGGGGAEAPTGDKDTFGAVGFDPEIVRARQSEGRTGVVAAINFERDSTLVKRMGGNMPLYKPQYWDKVKQLDRDNNDEDPSANNCMPAGVPRVGAPTQIVQTAKVLYFMYVPGGASGFSPTFRAIPTDGRSHTSIEDLDGTWNGESIGHWEGDTMVIDSIGFTTNTWLDKQGYFHSENMHVIERLRRVGNTLTWQATVDDPDLLMQPWVMDPVTVRENPNPMAVLAEPNPCSDRDLAHTVTKEHH
jgi:hypothetical protein